MSIGILLLRLVVGGIFLGHGAQKLLGWFGGGGPSGTERLFGSMGWRPARTMAIVAGLGETLGGLCLLLGLLTPLGAFAVIGVMTNAILAVHAPKGFWNTKGGIEFPLTLLVAAAALGFIGPGRYSLDRAMGIAWPHVPTGALVAAIGLVVGVVVFVVGHGRPAAETSTRLQPPRAA
jgi:putative oxidoreductase